MKLYGFVNRSVLYTTIITDVSSTLTSEGARQGAAGRPGLNRLGVQHRNSSPADSPKVTFSGAAAAAPRCCHHVEQKAPCGGESFGDHHDRTRGAHSEGVPQSVRRQRTR